MLGICWKILLSNIFVLLCSLNCEWFMSDIHWVSHSVHTFLVIIHWALNQIYFILVTSKMNWNGIDTQTQIVFIYEAKNQIKLMGKSEKKKIFRYSILFTIFCFIGHWDILNTILFAQSKHWIFHFVFWRRQGQLLWHTSTQHVGGWPEIDFLSFNFVVNDYTKENAMKKERNKRFLFPFLFMFCSIEIWNYIIPSQTNKKGRCLSLWWFNIKVRSILGFYLRVDENQRLFFLFHSIDHRQ